MYNCDCAASFQEKLLLDPMFDVPRSDIVAVHVDEGAVLGRNTIQYIHSQQNENAESDVDNSSGSTDNLSRTGCAKGDSVAA